MPTPTPTPTPTPPPPPPPTPTPPPPPPPTPTPPPPPSTLYPHLGTDCAGGTLTIYTYNSVFSASDVGYDSNGSSFFGYFIYNGVIYSYSAGNSIVITSYPHTGIDCDANTVTIYTNSPQFSLGSTVYSDECRSSAYTGFFIYQQTAYYYNSGNLTQTSYAHIGTDCSTESSPAVVYTNSSSFDVQDIGYADQCLFTTYNGIIVYQGIVYTYTDGVGSRYSYGYAGSDGTNALTLYTSQGSFPNNAFSDPCLTTIYDGLFIYETVVYSISSGTPTVICFAYSATLCNSNATTIYTDFSPFNYTDTAYSDLSLTTAFNGTVTLDGITYSYTNGVGSISECAPAPSPTPTPTENPQLLKSQIHYNYQTGSAVWESFRTTLTGLFAANSGTNKSDYRDHVIREFNRKISILNQPTGLFISPYDDGFRFTGTSVY